MGLARGDAPVPGIFAAALQGGTAMDIGKNIRALSACPRRGGGPDLLAESFARDTQPLDKEGAV